MYNTKDWKDITFNMHHEFLNFNWPTWSTSIQYNEIEGPGTGQCESRKQKIYKLLKIPIAQQLIELDIIIFTQPSAESVFWNVCLFVCLSVGNPKKEAENE